MWVYEADGHFIEPQLVDTIKFYAGERYSVMVKLNKQPRDYTIRVTDSGLTQIIASYATLRYKGGRQDLGETQGIISYGGLNITAVITLDRDYLPPFPPNPPAAHADSIHLLETHRWHSAWQYTMTGGGMYQEDRSAYEPLLHNPYSADAMNESLVIRTKNNTWVDLVIQVGSLPEQPQEFPHIMHKHTGKTWQIGAGEGHWNYSTVDEAMLAEPTKFNLKNPNYRDTFITSFDGPSWIVLRYHSNNPGPWLMHCHFEIHLGGGMAVAILDGVDAWPEVPPEYGADQRGFYLDDGQQHAASESEKYGNGEPEAENKADEAALAGEIAQIIEGHKGHRLGGHWNNLIREIIAFLEALISKDGGDSS